MLCKKAKKIFKVLKKNKEKIEEERKEEFECMDAGVCPNCASEDIEESGCAITHYTCLDCEYTAKDLYF